MNLNVFSRPFPYLDSYRSRLIHVSVILVFSVFFMEVFEPFNLNVWLQYKGWIASMGMAGFGILGTVIIAISQLVIRPLVPIKKFRVKHFIIWFAGELLFITLFLTLFYRDFQSGYFSELKSILKYTSLVLVLPYSFSILIIALVYFRREKQAGRIVASNTPDLIHFKDERGEVKFSLKRKDLLYLESTDNYVAVHFSNEGKPFRELVRTSLKKIENSHITPGLVRCHRGFMVNMENVLWMKKQGRNFFLKIQGIVPFIPVSRSFIPRFKEYLKL